VPSNYTAVKKLNAILAPSRNKTKTVGEIGLTCRERETDRQTDRQTDRDTDTDTDTDRRTDRQRQKDIHWPGMCCY